MKIALIGYGRMGKEIEKVAIQRNHSVDLIIDVHNEDELNAENLKNIDVVIEFTIPDSAVNHYKICFDAGVPIVSGTTGWLERWDEVIKYCEERNGTFLYGSNFSLGVNLFFELNRKLAKLMQAFDQYKVEMTEVHHTKKLDAPSGTAISLAEDILKAYPSKQKWINNTTTNSEELGIVSVREGEVPGIHTIKYESDVDFIEITHSAKSRQGFVFGAVLAAEFAANQKGILTMDQVLKSFL